MGKLITFMLSALATSSAIASSAVAKSDGNLLNVAATVTDMSEFEQGMSSQWASVFYQVNQDLNMAKYTAESDGYSAAVWLYGTTQLPASYDPEWVSGYVSRAHELYVETASNTESETSNEESSNPSSSSSSSEKSSSAAMPRAYSLSVASLVLASVIAAAALL